MSYTTLKPLIIVECINNFVTTLENGLMYKIKDHKLSKISLTRVQNGKMILKWSWYILSLNNYVNEENMVACRAELHNDTVI